MILVGQYDSPFVRRVAVTLHHYRLALRAQSPVGVQSGDGRDQSRWCAFPRSSSMATRRSIDSAAILDYLDELVGPKRALMPRIGR